MENKTNHTNEQYEAPKILTHSMEGMEDVSMEVNACTGGFPLRRGPGTPDEGDGTLGRDAEAEVFY